MKLPGLTGNAIICHPPGGKTKLPTSIFANLFSVVEITTELSRGKKAGRQWMILH
jgi:hypothetical protein